MEEGCVKHIDSSNSQTHLIHERQVLIIYTGGTIGMMKGTNGLTPKRHFLYEYLMNHPNFCDKEYTLKNRNPDCDKNCLITPEIFPDRRIFYNILEFDEIIDSANMNLEYWKLIGRTIEKYYNEYDAFIILHGTDTMNYTACILSFMLENLNKPVILTGSQIPLIEMRNDALKNLVDSLTIAGLYHIPEVTLMFDSKLFRGNRTIKNDNMGLMAFESPNLRPLVEIGINVKVNWDIILQPPTDEFKYFEIIDCHICVIKFFPMIKDSTFESFFKPFIKGVIIETYSSYKIPLDRAKITSIVKEANERGVVIVNVSQCRKGNGVCYEGDLLESCGVVNGMDMTVECCLAKLSYLLGKGYDQKTIKSHFNQSLRGEVSINQTDLSTPFVNALLNLIEKNDENYIIASTLLPTIINGIVEKNNFPLLKKMKKMIKIINFSNFSKFNKKNPLHFAAINGNLEIAKFLLKCRMNINEVDEDQCTPLNYACKFNNRELALFLKDNGGILNHSKDMGEFFCSKAFQGDIESIKLFYECGANLMIGDYDKKTLAHVAASHAKTDIIKFLVNDTNVNIMVADRWGNTPYTDASQEIKEIIKNKFSVDCHTHHSKKKRKLILRKIEKASSIKD